MTSKGVLKAVERLYSGKYSVTLLLDRVNNIEALNGADLDVEIKKHREKRSLNANGLLWKCLGEMAAVLNVDKWEVYLRMLKRYGAYTYVCVPPQAVEMLKKQWRECEEIGTININGRSATQLLCYYGSSTYNTKQFSVLLDGVISEMKEMGLEPPTSELMKATLERWENECMTSAEKTTLGGM